MWFYNQEYKLEELIVKLNPNQEWYKACYSFHSSDDEIRDLVSYVKPKRVYPNVIPLNSSLDEVIKTCCIFFIIIIVFIALAVTFSPAFKLTVEKLKK